MTTFKTTVVAVVAFAAGILLNTEQSSRRQLSILKSLLPANDPRSIQLKTHNPLDPEFRKQSNELRQFLEPAQIVSLAKFTMLLRESHCQHSPKAFDSLNQYIHTQFSLDERLKWLNPIKGVLRSLNSESTIPCEESTKYWIDSGDWQAIPMWSHCCNKAAAITKCPSPVSQTPSQCTVSDSLGASRPPCESDGTLLCLEYLRHEKDSDCLVYTFGIADAWDFEDWAGSLGCEVHAHDPTTKYKERHEAHNSPNVRFHYAGLAAKEGTASNFKSTGYGALGGEMLSLKGLWEKNGHAEQKRRITLLKIDCEGCEWESFHQLATNEPEMLEQVCTIILEVHVAETLQMKTASQLRLMASFWENYVEKFGFRFWYLHENTGAKFDQRVNPFLLDLGLDPTVCCYEMALRRPDCGVHRRSISPEI